MKRLILLAVLGASLTGCAGDPVKLQQNHTYVLEWIGERPLIDNSHLTVTLDDAGRAYGSGGCNHWFAPYTLDGDKLTFGGVGSTRKACGGCACSCKSMARACAPALMEQEQRFFEALQTVQRWDISPIEQVRFWPEQGKPLRLWPEEG